MEEIGRRSTLGVPHLLVHGTVDQPQHVITSSLEDAMVYAEHLANDRDEQSFRVFEMREVPMEVKRYYAVELLRSEARSGQDDQSTTMDDIGVAVDVTVEAADEEAPVIDLTPLGAGFDDEATGGSDGPEVAPPAARTRDDFYRFDESDDEEPDEAVDGAEPEDHDSGGDDRHPRVVPMSA